MQGASSQALSFYKKSCDDGDAVGCKSYAHLYDDLLNGTIRINNANDYQQAVFYNKKACEGGEMSACVKVGDLFSNASNFLPSVAPDYQQAIKYYNIACDAGEMYILHEAWYSFRGGTRRHPRL